jgi:hypothetical protein
MNPSIDSKANLYTRLKFTMVPITHNQNHQRSLSGDQTQQKDGRDCTQTHTYTTIQSKYQ